MSMFRRTIVAICAAAVLPLIYASVASAAGTPTIGVINVLPVLEPTSVQFLTNVNPNGAATTVKVEYAETNPEKGEYQIWSTQGIGSGSANVPVTAHPTGLAPRKTYQWRVTASNSSGSTVKYGTTSKSQWHVEGLANGTSKPVPVGISGTFALEYNSSGVPIKLECHSSGSATIHTLYGASDSYSMTMSNCHYYVYGTEACTPKKGFSLSFTGTLTSKESYVLPEFCPGEGEKTPVNFQHPFAAQLVSGGWENPVSGFVVTDDVTVKGNAGTITMNQEWWLAGEYLGKKFWVEE